jgi:gallate decarboxylase subunit D
MLEYQLEKGRIKINLKAHLIGDDLVVILSGGDKPHVGCVTLSVPRPSLANEHMISATTSTFNLIGHKDDEVARYVSHELAARLNKNVVLTCGIHIEQISVDEITAVLDLTKEITNRFIDSLIKD